MKNRKLYAYDALYNTIGNVAYYFALWLTTVIVVRLSGYEDAGIFSVAMTISNVFFVIGNYGIRSFQASDINHEYSNQEYITARYVSVSLSMLLCLLVCFFLQYDYRHISAILLYMIFKCTEAFSDVLYGIWQHNNRLRNAGISMCVKATLIAIIFALLMYYTNINNAILGIVIANFFVVIMFDIPKTKKIEKNIFVLTSKSFKKSISLLRHTFFMFVVSICPMILQAIPKLIFEKKFSTEELGVYSSISSPTTIIPTLISCIMIPVLPLFAKYIEEKERKKLFLLFALFFVGVIFLGVLTIGIASLFGDWGLYFLFGRDLSMYIDLLIAIIISITISCLLYCYNALFISGRKIGILSTTYILSNVLCLCVSGNIINTWGIMGIAYALILVQLSQCICLSFLSITFFRK